MAHKMLIYSTTDLQTITDSMGNNIKFIADLARHNGEVADVHFLLINPRKEENICGYFL